jgi:hypothetical protein
LLAAVAWACLAGGALRAQSPSDPATSPLALALSPTPAASAFDGIDPTAGAYLASPPGWFVQAQAEVVKPRISKFNTADPFQFLYDPPLRPADLNWGSAGELGVGYRTGDENGFLLSFRGGSWTGHQQSGREAFGPAGPIGSYWTGGTTAWSPDTSTPWARDLHSRLSFARVDLDYLGSGWPVTEFARVGWSAGARVAWFAADLSADDSFGAFQAALDPATGATLSQQPLRVFEHKRASVSLAAGGLHFATDGTVALGQTGLALFAGVDGGLLGGREEGHYAHGAGDPGTANNPRTSENRSALAATLNASAGVQYVVPWRRASLRFSAGYQFEAWWSATAQGGSGNFGNVAPSEPGPLFGELGWQSQGLFLRSEFVY